MPNVGGKGFVDDVLWGDDGKSLGLVEAKRARRDPRVGQQQARLYADCLEQQSWQRPLIFYSNGYEHWLWDDDRYPLRRVQGFYKKAELELAVQGRATRRSLAGRRGPRFRLDLPDDDGADRRDQGWPAALGVGHFDLLIAGHATCWPRWLVRPHR